jgi:Tol biopolymer transport system component
MRQLFSVVFVGIALTAIPALRANAAYPGANGRIAYQIEDDNGGPTHLWWANPDLSDAKQLTSGDYDTFDPAWSADGKLLVFSTVEYATAPPPFPGFRVDVETLNVATGQHHVLRGGGIIKESPSFSPDGTRILFARTDPVTGIGMGLYTMRATDGGDIQAVTGLPKGTDYLQWPRYAPDGSRIAFTAVKGPSLQAQGLAPREGAVYVVNSDGRGLHRLTPFGDLLNFEVDWSPDGSQLVMQTDWRPGTRPSLWIMNADGSNLRRLTDETPTGRGLPFQASFAPSWSPDGSLIMFNCAPGELGFWDLCTIRPDGTGRTVVRSTPEFEHRPTWQPLP